MLLDPLFILGFIGMPVIDVTRKSVEETAASIIKIFEIQNKNV